MHIDIKLILFILLITSLYSNNYIVLNSEDNTILSSELILCEKVLKNGKYFPLKTNIVNCGNRIYIFSRVKVRGVIKEGAYFKYNVSWHLNIYDPLNMTIYSSSSFTKLYKTRSSVMIWTVWWPWDIRHYASRWIFNGEYRVVLEIVDEITGNRVINKTMLIVKNGFERCIEYTLKNELIIENPSSNETALHKLFMAVIHTLKPFQIVVSGPSFNLKPSHYISDKYGNIYAVFENLRIKPHSRLIIYSNYTVRINVLRIIRTKYTLNDLKQFYENMSLYISPEKDIESNSSEIIDEALRIKDGIDNTYDICCRLTEFTSKYIKYTPGANWSGALQTYLRKKGVCMHFSWLYVALARALKIPSQIASGYGFIDSGIDIVENKWFTVKEFHAWVLVFIPGFGWVPIEPQRGREYFAITPYTHIMLVKSTSSDIELDGVKMEATAFHYTYSNTPPNAKMYLYWKVRSLHQLKEIDMNIKYYNRTVYAGGSLLIKGYLDIPISDNLIIILKNPVNYVNFTSYSMNNGLINIWIKIPPKNSSIGKWILKLIYPGNEEYNYVEKTLYFNVVKKKSNIHVNIPREITIGDQLIIEGYLEPRIEGESIIIKLISNENKTLTYSTKTNENGEFRKEISTLTLPAGKWRVRVEWGGGGKDYLYEGSYIDSTLIIKENLLIKYGIPLAVILLITLIILIKVLRKKAR